MSERLIERSPLLAALAAVAVFTLVIALGAGVDGRTLALWIFVPLALGEGVLLALKPRPGKGDKHARQLRFIAERFQSMVRALPGGYCLFSPQGILREEYGLAGRFGLDKVGHFEDLVACVKEGPDLLAAFRKLQEEGASFRMPVRRMDESARFEVAGRRFQIGREGPWLDLLWFSDLSSKESAPEVQAASGGQDLAQAFADRFPIPLWGRGGDARLVFCNAAYAKILGVSCAEVLRDQKELMSQTAKGGSGRALAEKAAATKQKQTERRHVVVEGKRRLLEIAELPLPSAEEGAQTQGAPARDKNAPLIYGFAIDMTGEEEKEAELNRHLAAHHEVMEHLGAAIAIYGSDTKLEFYNRPYQRLWDAEESFLDSKPTFSEVMEDLRTRRRLPEQADFQRYKKERLALFTSLLEPQEDLMVLPDETTLRILVAPHPFGGLIFVHEDVSDRLALESSYNTLMAVQKETLDNLAEGIAVYGPDGKLRLSNPAFGKIWKLDAAFLATSPHVADVLDQTRALFTVADEEWGAFKADLVGYSLDRQSRTGRVARTDQSLVEYLTNPLPDGSVLNSYLDVTDSMRVEQALRASNAALAAADRLKSDFVANVSYQLRTPLNTIAGFAEILAEQYFGMLNDRQMEYTRTIKAESDKLSRLINDVLDLAIIEAGRMTLARTDVSVFRLLNDAKQMTAEWARQQSLEIVLDCPADLGTFEADEHRMKQVMFNLISNAIKYTPPGGRIALAGSEKDEWVVLSVLDTGIGIPESDRERVFGKFERANVAARQNGAGLGLSLVRSFVELHGGRVEIQSDIKFGTRVSCYMPRRAPLGEDVTHAPDLPPSMDLLEAVDAQ